MPQVGFSAQIGTVSVEHELVQLQSLWDEKQRRQRLFSSSASSCRFDGILLEIDRYGFFGADADTNTSAMHGPIADNRYF